MLDPLPFPEKLGACDRLPIVADAPAGDVPIIQFIGQSVEAFDRLRLQAAVGEFLDAVG